MGEPARTRSAAGVAQTIAALRDLLGERLSTAEAVRDQHGRDQTWNAAGLPDAVAFVESTEEVQAIVRACAATNTPVIAYGTGTSLEGHITAPDGGISIDLTRMNRILEVNTQDLDCRVQAGVTRKALNEHLRDTGLFFPIDPGADASIGGMAATRASGTNAVRYGTMRENVLNLTAVMASGEVIHTARRARKSAAGYDLTRVLVGSEGTLGIITEVTLRLYGIPESISAGVCPFDSLEGACQAVIQTIQLGLPVARIELLDADQVRVCNAYSELGLAEVPTLFLEFHGTPAGTREQSELFAEIAAANGGGTFAWATHQEDRSRLWQARHDVFWAGRAYLPGKSVLATDVCVPISRLADCVIDTKRDLEAHGMFGPIVGHVGDGNFHVMVFCDMDDPDDVKRVKAFTERLALRALAMEGTCTGEHGVGRGKMKFLEAEHGPALAYMRALKRAFDPQNILNPGKIVAL
ncbi:FAD-binding oxidoreductase [Rhodoligotrophos defluvii]|uniref:FAD-binding oxidoreductase n=1 Tax=Rhodoligotrophos defluvii TaxID=2561934 RepID=UPI001EEFF257|nr:FAD-linked oxidase C-terminal domain-containing protein [Rhodoligotrophos defluvii]